MLLIILALIINYSDNFCSPVANNNKEHLINFLICLPNYHTSNTSHLKAVIIQLYGTGFRVMPSEIEKLQSQVKNLKGQLLSYTTMEDILKNKSELLTVALMENQVLRLRLNKMLQSKSDQKPNSENIKIKDHENLLLNTNIVYGESFLEPTQTLTDTNAEQNSRKQNIYYDYDCLKAAMGTNTKTDPVLDPSMHHKYQDNFTEKNVTETLSNHIPSDVNFNDLLLDVIINDQNCVDANKTNINSSTQIASVEINNTDRNEQELISNKQFLLQTGNDVNRRKDWMSKSLPIAVDINCFNVDSHSDVINNDSINTVATDRTSKGEVECETSGVHLVARSSDPCGPTKEYIQKKHYVNEGLTIGVKPKTKMFDQKTRKLPSPCDNNKVPDSKICDNKTDIFITENDTDKSSSCSSENKVVELLRCVEKCEAELSSKKEYIIALEKENKFFKKKLQNVSAASISEGFKEHIQLPGLHIKTVKSDTESEETIKELSLKVTTLKKSLKDVAQHEQTTVLMKDRIIKDIKRKHNEEKMRNKQLNDELIRMNNGNDFICRTCENCAGADAGFVTDRVDSMVVRDLLTEVSVLHQQAVLLSEDFEAEQTDKNRIRASHKHIQEKLEEVKKYVVKLEAQLESSEKNLRSALKTCDKLQEQYHKVLFESEKTNKSHSCVPAAPARKQPSPPVAPREDVWNCQSCGCSNHPKRTVCDFCGILKVPPPRPSKRRQSSPPIMMMMDKNREAPNYADNSSTPFTNNHSFFNKNWQKNNNEKILEQTATNKPSGISPKLERKNSLTKSPFGISNGSSVTDKPTLWELQEEQLRLLSPYHKPLRLVPRSPPNTQKQNCDVLGMSFYTSKSV